MKCSSRGEITAIARAYLAKKGRHPMATSHPNPTPSGVLGTVAKLIRLTQKEDVEWSHWKHPTNNPKARRNLAEYLKKGCPKVVTKQFPECYNLARLILGDDYITPTGVHYTKNQLQHFVDTMPDVQTILWLNANGYMLVAGPPREMNLLEVRGFDNKLFYSMAEGWYAGDNQTFAKNDKVSAGEWLAIRKEEVPGSFSKTWKEQQDLITEVEYVPNASEVSYAVIAYFRVCGIYLLRGKYVRTSSVSLNGSHVDVGDFDGGGLNISSDWDYGRSDGIGIASARKLTLT
ncbi:MAG: hypothetical protein Q8P93_01960 [bacterium]|nr:hypothetical protein [bacterium]